MAPSPYLNLTSPLNYNESVSGDVDTYTSYTDTLGQPSRAYWVLNQLGTNTLTGSLNSPSDGSDAIPLYVQTGYAISGYSLSVTNGAINQAHFDLNSNDGTVNVDRPLASFSSSAVLHSDFYTITMANGPVIANYTLNLSIIKVNEAPTESGNYNDPIFTVGGTAVNPFSDVNISTVENGQKITKLSLSVDGVVDGGNEILNIDGANIQLRDGVSDHTSSGIAYNVTQSDGSMVVSLTISNGIASTQLQAVLDDMTYSNASTTPTLGDRYINLLSISDDGGTANGGVDTADLFDYSIVTVAAPANAAPIITNSGGSVTFTEGAVPTVVDSGISLTDLDNTTLASATVSISGAFHVGQDLLAFSSNSS
ncbi:hypothetical protein QN391_07220, partial [Pseudomonas sp. CCI1.2]|uniref:hypothetical protein n=1 Tax=Pseudomonas sp. CCI1.2 TaxID=3048614 RepID=UPI002B225651